MGNLIFLFWYFVLVSRTIFKEINFLIRIFDFNQLIKNIMLRDSLCCGFLGFGIFRELFPGSFPWRAFSKALQKKQLN
jgi:hypothetical protein